ncbi:hypothetical protein CDAR_226361 [Caerostris darwini]|uniref:Uncharacterized protein n=1 Tax=Caerostris darwini TaxID=1538125 RepID=A0AAV4ULR2_9ARAC|nr:hypothetical protein CDAR_226361 [Caerostris darwini]
MKRQQEKRNTTCEMLLAQYERKAMKSGSIFRNPKSKRSWTRMTYSQRRAVFLLTIFIAGFALELVTITNAHHHRKHNNMEELLILTGIIAKVLQRNHHHKSHPIPIPVIIPVHHHGHHHHGHHHHG